MRVAARLAFGELRRSLSRVLLRVAVLAVATALLGAMILFVGTSLKSMSASAVRSVPLDWQGPVGSAAADRRLATAVGRQPGVRTALPTATAPFVAASTSAGGGTTNAGSGAVLAVPPGYAERISTIRFLQGALRPGEVVLDQQLAATLHARLGDTVHLRPSRRARPVSYRVGGVALVTHPDVLFQPLDPQAGPAPAQPPANVAILPYETFASTYAPHLRTLTPATVGASVQPGAQDGVQWEVHAQLDPGPLTGGSPSHALTTATQTVNRVQRSLPGQIRFVDNLSDSLNTSAGDALYAQTLYIMLAVPGALIALGLAYLAALGTAERDRREISLLRARGASRSTLLGLAATESVVTGTLGGLAGAGLAFVAVAALVPGGVTTSTGRVVATVVACVILGIGGAAAARLGAVAGALRESVLEGRRSARRAERPLWQRLYLDVAALVVSGLIYWLTARTGFSAVVNPDSNPTLSLSVYMFFAPALLWIGATLMLVRFRGRLVSWIAARGAGGSSGARRFLLASASRRGAAINRGLVVVGLLLAFGVNLGLFTATYDQQAHVDAQLTLGADVVTTAPPGVTARRDLSARVAAVPGVAAASPVDHSYAYVGPDLQDTFGVDARTLGAATTLRDSYLVGSDWKSTLAFLRGHPDGILVSKETISDYQLKVGDLLRLRVLDRPTGRFRVVPFHVAGTVQEFPSAPRDSFMVANLSYLQRASRDAGPNVVFASARGDSAAVARRVAAATRSDGTAVKDITEQARQTVSSITTIDLTGISRIEEAFAVALAAAAMILFLALGLAERRHELATMSALGASVRDVAAFLWVEAGIVLVGSLVLAAVLGTLLSLMLVALLQHVFDPPPDALAVPGAFLGELAGAAVIGTLLAGGFVLRSVRRLPLGALLREQ